MLEQQRFLSRAFPGACALERAIEHSTNPKHPRLPTEELQRPDPRNLSQHVHRTKDSEPTGTNACH
jgi:hypothetical protein